MRNRLIIKRRFPVKCRYFRKSELNRKQEAKNRNYGIIHKANKLLDNSLYSIAEFNKKKISQYRIIANPGCYPTSIQIPLIPLIKKQLINIENLTIDSKSGYSGAGKNLEKKFKHKNLYYSTFAYATKNHRHISEIEQEFKKYTKKNIKFTFNPHILPTFRGILTSIYINLKKNSSSKKLRNELVKYYKKNKFIKILKLNSELGSGNVLNTNNCEISICDTRIKNKILLGLSLLPFWSKVTPQRYKHISLSTFNYYTKRKQPLYKLNDFINAEMVS